MSNENQFIGSSWTANEFEKLIELVKPHSFLYNVQDPSRKNILARESTWELIAKELCKPVEECKKRWRALRDGYMKTLKNTKPNVGVFKQLEFLSEAVESRDDENTQEIDQIILSTREDGTEQVITDTQEYYEITIADNPHDDKSYIPNLLIPINSDEPPKKIGRKNCGRKKYMPPPINLTPIKILPKPVVVDGAKLIPLQEAPKMVTQVAKSTPNTPRSEVLDSLIEKVLKEHTNEIDVFFRSMAASVKKLQPNLIPKVKMEVCNVIAKYEMQSFDKNANGF